MLSTGDGRDVAIGSWSWSAVRMQPGSSIGLIAARLVSELAELVLPTQCGGCGCPGTMMCRGCIRRISADLDRPARRVAPQPEPTGFPPTWAQGTFSGVLQQVVRNHKDADRPDLCRWCSPYLRNALAACLEADGVVRDAVMSGAALVTVVPSSQRALRTRGREPLWEILRGAYRADDVGLAEPVRLLRVARRTRDQAGLSAVERGRNVNRSMVVPTQLMPMVAGRVVVLADDIVTTGSTLVEAHRALRAAGATYVAAVCVAATPRDGYRQGMEHTAGRHDLRDVPFRVSGGGDASA